ncbi:MAG: hypothetical protein E7277_08960 [Lachnospiraceae bacterium]|nr:hypothetical protein [Lachnospiraceae bacterium]
MSRSYDDYEPPYFWATKDCPNVIYISIGMKDEVDEKVLDKAVQTAIKRFPYFQVALNREGEDILQVFDERPILVKKWQGPVWLGTEEANGHILVVSYTENEIIIEISHYITDGAGFVPFVKSVLYYYVSDYYQVSLKKESVYLTDTPFFAGETGDPYGNIDFSKIEPALYHYKKGELLVPDDVGIEVGWGNTVYYVDINEKAFVDYAKNQGASPSAMFSILLMRTFRKLCPQSEKKIVCGIGTNQKAVMGERYNYRMGSSRAYVEYPKAVENWDDDRLTVITRGSVLLQNQPENVLEHEKLMRGLDAQTKMIPTLKERCEKTGLTKYKLPVSSTYDVSYVGKMDWGDLEDYITGIYSEVNFMTGNAMLVEVNAIHGKLTLAIMQGFEDRKILECFIEELKVLGISAKIVRKRKMETAVMDVLRV